MNNLKKILFLLSLSLIMNTAIPMEETDYQVLDRLTLINAGLLPVQAGLLYWLKKNNHLFGEELVPAKINLWNTPLAIKTKFWLVAFGCAGFLTALAPPIREGHWGAPCEYVGSQLSVGLRILVLLSGFVHMCNDSHQDMLESLKKALKKISIALKSKIKIDTTILNDAKCPICLNQPNSDCINPCKQADHIYCRECLIGCFNNQRNQSRFRDNGSFFCELCRRTIPLNSEKLEIILPKKPRTRVTLKLWAKEFLGINAIACGFGIYTLYEILQCQFS